jgi:hypothetical protein
MAPPAFEMVRVAFGLDAEGSRHVRDGLVALAPNSVGVLAVERALRSAERSCGAAPIASVSSASINAW